MSDEYWLCCGSKSYEAHHGHCREAAHGFPQHCRFGTSEEHSKWGNGMVETKYATIDRDELKRLQKDAERYRFIRNADECDHLLSYAEIMSYAGEDLDTAIDGAIIAAQGDSHE